MAAFLRRADSLTGRAFLRRLSAAFGWRYVAACILAYGVNQGMGEKFVFGARQYYLLDDIGMTSAEYGRVAGFSHIPWQLKSLFGLLSDTVPLGGLHRAPYMLIAGVLGLFALGMLTALPAATVSAPLAGFLLLLTNVNFAMPDVMIDATVAERAKAPAPRPPLARPSPAPRPPLAMHALLRCRFGRSSARRCRRSAGARSAWLACRPGWSRGT